MLITNKKDIKLIYLANGINTKVNNNLVNSKHIQFKGHTIHLKVLTVNRGSFW